MAEYDKEFEADVLAQCLIDSKFMRAAALVLDQIHFVVPEHAWIWKVMREQWLATSELAHPALFRSRIDSEPVTESDKRVKLDTILRIFKRAPKAPRTSLEELRRFTRAVRLQTAIESSIKLQEKGKWDEAWEPVRNAIRSDIQRSDYQVTHWAEEFQIRQGERRHRRENPSQYKCIPTGLRRLDRVITGASEGELCGIMAVTNRGKSILAMNFGFSAVTRGYGVIHFSTEMGHRKVAQRYDSRFTRIAYRKFKQFDFSDTELSELDRIFQTSSKRFAGRLKIVSTPLRACTIDMLRSAIDALRADMSRLDMIIVDSGDHLQARGRFEKAYQAEASNFWDLKDLAEELQVPFWVTLQAGRDFETKIASTAAAAGSYDKSRICDLLISINEIAAAKDASSIVFRSEAKSEALPDQTKGLKKLKLYLAKNRDDISRTIIPIEADLSRMLIQEIEEERVAAEEGSDV